MGIVKGKYSPEDWLTMKMYRFGSIPHLTKKNIQKKGLYDSRIKYEKACLKEYLDREMESA